MYQLRSRRLSTVNMGRSAGVLRIGLLFVLSGVSASATPLAEVKRDRPLGNLPRNYCLANMASLGTGLVRAPFLSGPKSLSHKGRPWTGWIRASASGRYEFSLPKSGGHILVNKHQVFSRSAMSSKPVVIQIELATNRFYAITVETTNSEDSALPLEWRRPDGRREIVPQAYLYAPVATTGVNQTKITASH